jgi:phosphatidate cytidylyltransferase
VAIAVGVGLGAVIIAALLLFRQAFVGIVALAVAASIWELKGTLATARGISLTWIPMLFGGVATVILAWPYGLLAQVVGISLTVLACLIWRLFAGQDGYLRDVSASAFVAVYVAFFASFATLLVSPENGAERVLSFLIVVVASDTGGYATGVLFGKHPMAPAISPKKSWEGFAGSVLGAVLGGSLSLALLLNEDWWKGAILGLVVCIVATLGDLIESMIKRDIGVKDMGSLLPGHGGVMDRMDSLLPSAAVSWMMISWMVN